MLRLAANQPKLGVDSRDKYGLREQTGRENLAELQAIFGFQPCATLSHFRTPGRRLNELAWQAEKCIVQATT